MCLNYLHMSFPTQADALLINTTLPSPSFAEYPYSPTSDSHRDYWLDFSVLLLLFFFYILKHVTVELPFALNVLRCVFFFFFEGIWIWYGDTTIKSKIQSSSSGAKLYHSWPILICWLFSVTKKCLNLCQNEKGICLWKNIDFSPC